MRKGVFPPAPSPQLSLLRSLCRGSGACPGTRLLSPGPAPAREQRAALTMMEKMRGMRLRGHTGQKQEAMARMR